MILVSFLDSLYSRLPGFSREIKDFIVKVLPFISLIIGILVTFSSVIDLLGTPFLEAFTSSGESTIFQRLMIVNILGLFEGIFLILAFVGLRRKKKIGWNFIFWSQVLFIVSALMSISPSFILGFLFFYPLLQIRTIYR